MVASTCRTMVHHGRTMVDHRRPWVDHGRPWFDHGRPWVDHGYDVIQRRKAMYDVVRRCTTLYDDVRRCTTLYDVVRRCKRKAEPTFIVASFSETSLIVCRQFGPSECSWALLGRFLERSWGAWFTAWLNLCNLGSVALWISLSSSLPLWRSSFLAL